MPSFKDQLNHYRRPLVWSGAALLLYGLLGFFLLPWSVERALTNTLAQRLQLTTRIESVYFNPFTFYFELRGLQVDDGAAGNLLGLGDLHLNLEPSRLLLLRIKFAEISISDLEMRLDRASTERNTVSILADRWALTAGTEATAAAPEESGEIVPLQIDSLQLANIQLHVTDAVPEIPFATTLRLAAAQIDGFSTLPDARGNNALTINFEEGARLDWQGGFTVNPLEFVGSITLSDLNLAAASRYVQEALPFRLDTGLLHAGLTYDVSLLDVPEIALTQIRVQLEDLSAIETGAIRPFFIANTIGFSDGAMSMPANEVVIPLVQLQDMQITATRDSTGTVDLQRMLAAFTGPPSDAVAGTNTGPDDGNDSPPWSVAIEELRFRDNRLAFADEYLATPTTTAASFEATVSGINNADQTRIPVNASLQLESGGSLALAAEVQALPTTALTGTAVIDNLELSALQAYLQEYTSLVLADGAVLANIAYSADAAEPLAISGDVEVVRLQLTDALLGESLLSLTRLALDNVAYSSAGNSADISEITVADLTSRVIVYEDATTNIGRSLATANSPAAAANSDPAPAAGDTAMPALTIGRITLSNIASEFTDRNLPLEFNASIRELGGVIDGISTTSSQATAITLEGQVGEFGLLQLTGSLSPFDFAGQSAIDLNFTNIDLPSVTPYVIKFAGREVDAGKVDLRLTYELVDGALTANNQMVLTDLRLGARVDQPGAMDLPLDLALALLKDGDGVIDLEIPVTGDINDPEFNLGPAIRRAITNIFTNLVTAPFRLLGSLVGGGADDSIDHIRFQPGRTTIAVPEQEVLMKLAAALLQRPQLLLEIPPVSSDAADSLALQVAAVTDRIEAMLATDAASQESLTTRRTHILEELYGATGLSPTLTELRVLHTVIPVSGPATATPQLDVFAYNADLRERLIAIEPVSAADIAALAAARADAVQQFLVTRGGIDATRLRVVTAASGELDEDGWMSMPFGLGAN